MAQHKIDQTVDAQVWFMLTMVLTRSSRSKIGSPGYETTELKQ